LDVTESSSVRKGGKSALSGKEKGTSTIKALISGEKKEKKKKGERRKEGLS